MSEWRRPTAAFISDRLGVSKSTVSRALAGHPGISKETRGRVTEVARELGYQPNAFARSLVTNRSRVVGMIIGDKWNPFYFEQLPHFIQYLSTKDIQLMLFHASPGQDVADIVPTVLKYQLEGCIIAAFSLSSKAAQICERYRVPVVLCNRTVVSGNACSVLCDNEKGARLVGELLADAGHKRLACVAGRPDRVTSHDRENGFRKGLASRDMAIHVRFDGDFTFEGGYRAGHELLKLSQIPDAVFCAADIMALGLLDAFREEGVRVPDDISVVGFDNIRAAAWPAYNLTTIAQPVDILIPRAVDLLIERIDDPGRSPEVVYLSGTLCRRGTARLPAEE